MLVPQLINKPIPKQVAEAASENEWLADFLISVRFGGETFETTAKDVPYD